METNKKPSNPQAFPTGIQDHRGMSLRDYFAAKVLAGIYSREYLFTEQKHFEQNAEISYKIADAMLKQREL